MRKMLLSVLAVAALSLSAGAAWAEVSCSPVCGLATPAEVNAVKARNTTHGTDTAASKMNSNAVTNNRAGIGQNQGGGNTGSGGVAF